MKPMSSSKIGRESDGEVHQALTVEEVASQAGFSSSPVFVTDSLKRLVKVFKSFGNIDSPAGTAPVQAWSVSSTKVLKVQECTRSCKDLPFLTLEPAEV